MTQLAQNKNREKYREIQWTLKLVLVCRLVMCEICAFLRIVWGCGKGEGYSPSVRASIQPDTTVGTVRFRTQYLKHFSRSNFLLCPF